MMSFLFFPIKESKLIRFLLTWRLLSYVIILHWQIKNLYLSQYLWEFIAITAL
jgi:hypothetical protein